jgi:hypothetical protein
LHVASCVASCILHYSCILVASDRRPRSRDGRRAADLYIHCRAGRRRGATHTHTHTHTRIYSRMHTRSGWFADAHALAGNISAPPPPPLPPSPSLLACPERSSARCGAARRVATAARDVATGILIRCGCCKICSRWATRCCCTRSRTAPRTPSASAVRPARSPKQTNTPNGMPQTNKQPNASLARASVVSHVDCFGAPNRWNAQRWNAICDDRHTRCWRTGPLAPAPPRHAPARQVPEDARPQPRRLQGTRRPRGDHAATMRLRSGDCRITHGRCRRTRRAGGSTTCTSSWRSSASSERFQQRSV